MYYFAFKNVCTKLYLREDPFKDQTGCTRRFIASCRAFLYSSTSKCQALKANSQQWVVIYQHTAIIKPRLLLPVFCCQIATYFNAGFGVWSLFQTLFWSIKKVCGFLGN